MLPNSTYQRLVSDISNIFEKAKLEATKTAKWISLGASWEIGRRIVEDEQKYKLRAEYGTNLLEQLSEDLSTKYGRGFSVTNLKYMRQFFLTYQIRQSIDELDWTQYIVLLSIKDHKLRQFYQRQSIKENWSVKELRERLKEDGIERQSFKEGIEEKKDKDIYLEATTTVKLPRRSGQLYTYKVIQPEYLHPVRKELSNRVRPLKKHSVVDLGFEIFREIELKGLTLQHDDIIQSDKGRKGYSFKIVAYPKEELYTYKAKVAELVDADTIIADIDCGFDTWTHQRLRLASIDTPELDTKKGQEAKQFVEKQLKGVSFVVIKTYKSDKYDRYLVDVFYSKDESNPSVILEKGIFLNQQLLDLGLAKLWQQG